MGLEQDIKTEYAKFKTEMAKVAVTSKQKSFNSKFFSKMDRLEGEMTKFSKEFDEKYVNSKTITIGSVVEMLPLIRDSFLSKIEEVKDFIDFNDLNANDWRKRVFIKCFNGLTDKFDHEKDIYGFFDVEKGIFENCMDCIDDDCEEISLIAAKKLLNFLADLFADMRIYFVEKKGWIIPEENEGVFFDIEEEELDKQLKYLHPELSRKDRKVMISMSRKKDGEESESDEEDPVKSFLKKRNKKYPIGSVPEGVKMFPAGKPLPGEVKQAGVGDCYLMAALISFAKTNPKVIEDCFVQGLKDIDKHDIIEIRFYGYDESHRWGPVYIKVSKNKVIEPEEIEGGALWPKILEKAYIAYNLLPHRALRSKNIDGGVSAKIMTIMTGKRSEILDMSEEKIEEVPRYPGSSITELSDKDKIKMNRLVDIIESKLKEGQAVTCSFKDHFLAMDAKTRAQMIFVQDRHAYAIVGVMRKDNPKNRNKFKKEYIRFIEPNRDVDELWGRKPELNSKRKAEGGHFALYTEEFYKNCKRIQYSTDEVYRE